MTRFCSFKRLVPCRQTLDCKICSIQDTLEDLTDHLFDKIAECCLLFFSQTWTKKSRFPNLVQLWLKVLPWSAIYQINHNPPKLPLFRNVSVKILFKSPLNSWDISILKDVGQAKFCLISLFIVGVPRGLKNFKPTIFNSILTGFATRSSLISSLKSLNLSWNTARHQDSRKKLRAQRQQNEPLQFWQYDHVNVSFEKN